MRKLYCTCFAASLWNTQRSFRAGLVVMVLMMMMMGGKGWGQTPVPMSSQSGLTYTENFADISNWTNNFASGIGASRWASYPITTGGSANDGKRTTKSSATFTTSTAGGVQKGTGNLVFLSTGSGTPSEAVAVDFLMDFTGVNAGTLSFNWAAVDNASGTRPTSLRVYWSTDNITFTELTAAQVIDVQSVSSGSITTITLPSNFNNSSTARLRFYNHAGNATGSGNRDKISIDNVTVTAVGYTGGGNIGNPGVNWVGANEDPTAYAQPNNCTVGDYRVLNYRRISTNTGTPSDGRGQWFTTINSKATGGNVKNSNLTGGSGAGFLFTNGGSCGSAGQYTNKWSFTGVGQGALDQVNLTTYNAGASAQDMGLNMSAAGRYTFVMKDVTSANGPAFYVGYTTNDPVSISHNTASQQSLTTGNSTITATLSATSSTEEKFYLRYRVGTNDFTTGTSVVLGSISGTTVSFTIPAVTFGQTVNYYILSTTHLTYTSLSEVDMALSTLRYADNSGLNYSYIMPTPPASATTDAVSSVTATSATLNGTVTAGNVNQGVTFNYGLTTSYGTNVTASPATVSGTASTTVSASATPLSPNTQYNYRVSINDGTTTLNGSNVAFYTLANVPSAPTVGTPTSVTLNVGINPNGNPVGTEFAIRETTSGNYVQADGSLGAAAVWQAAATWGTITVTGLTSTTVYTFAVAARNGSNVATALSASASGTTAACTQLATNLTVTAITGTGATVSWDDVPGTFEYAVTASASAPGSGTIITTYFADVSGLSNSSTYYLHVRTVCGGGRSAWTTISFTTNTTVALAIWNPSGLTAYGPSPFAPNPVNSNISVVGLTRGSGVGTNPTGAGNAWGGSMNAIATSITDAINKGQFITFSIAPISNYTVSISSLDLNYRRSGTGPVDGRLQYSLDGSNFTALPGISFTSSSNSGAIIPTIDLSGVAPLQAVPSTTTITFRIVLYNNSGTNGTWYVYGTGLVVKGSVATTVPIPVALPATAVSPGCFTANWKASTGATGYRLDISTSSAFGSGTPPSTLTQGFNNGLTPPTGWIFTNVSNTYTTAGNYNTNSPSIRLDYSGSSSVETGTYTGGATQLRLWIKGQNADPSNELLIEGYNGTSWVTIHSYTSLPLGGTTITYNAGTTPALPSGLTKFRFTYNKIAGGNLALDDVTVDYGNFTPSFVSGYENLSVSDTFKVVSGLSVNTTYYYRVRAEYPTVSANSGTISITTQDASTADFRSKATGDYSNSNIWEYHQGCGNWAVASSAPGPNNNVTIMAGHFVTLDVPFATINAGKTLLVKDSGTLYTQSTNYIAGGGSFVLSAGGIMQIGHFQGIVATGTSNGAIRTTTRTFSKAANYIYIYFGITGDQATGSALPDTVNTLSIGNYVTATQLTNSLTILSPVQSLNLVYGTFKVGASNTINISKGGAISNAAVPPYPGGGNFVETAEGGTINFLDSGTVTGNIHFYTCKISGGVQFDASADIRNKLQINAGGFVKNNKPPIYLTGSTLQYNTANSSPPYVRGAEWSTSTGAGYPHHVQISGNTTLDPGGTGAFKNTVLNTGGDLTIDAGSSMYMDYNSGANNMTVPLNIGGDLNLNGNLSASQITGVDIFIKGSYTNNGTTDNLFYNNRSINFNGAAAQVISGTNSFGFNFPYLVIANTSGGVSHTHSVSITNMGALTLTSGILTPLASLTIDNPATSGISGGSASSFINGPVTWKLPANLGTNTRVYNFPVGKLLPASAYLPFSLTHPKTTAVAPAITVEAFNTAYTGAAFDNTKIASLSGTEYWVASTTVGLTGGSVGLTRPADIGTLNTIANAPALSGTFISLNGTQNGLKTIDNSIDTDLGDNYFTMARAVPAPVIISFISDNPSGQSGYTGSVLTISGSNFTNASSVTISGVAAVSYSIINSGEITAVVGEGLPAAGFISITTPAGTGTSTGVSGTFTYLGYITKANTDWNTNTTWLGDGLPLVNTATTIANLVTVNGSVVNNPKAVTVNNTGTLTFGAAGAITVNNTFTNNGIVDMIAGGDITMNGNSTFTNTTGTTGFKGGAGTVVINGNIATTVVINGSLNFNNVTTNGGVRFVNNAGIDGTFQINSGGYVNTDAPTYNAGSLLKYNTTFNRTSEWGSLSGPGYPYNVQISNNSTFSAGGAGGTNVNIPLNMAGDLTIDAGSNFYMDFNGNNMILPLKILGNIAINGNLSASASPGGDIEIGKNWLHTTGTFAQNSRIVTFNGPADQTITKTGGETFSYLTLNKPGGKVILVNDLTVNLALVLTNGKLAVNGMLLTLNGSFSSSATNSLSGSKVSNLLLGAGYTGTLRFDQVTPFGNYLNKLTINATAITALSDSLNIAPCRADDFLNTGTLTISAGTFNTNGFLVLVSDETGTARIARGSSNSTYITSDVTVQRYIPKKRAWRLVTAPIASNVSINEAWQEGLVYNSQVGGGTTYEAGTGTVVNTTIPGWYGIHITGGTTLYPTPNAANAVGFDYGVTSGTPSIRIFDNLNWNKTLPTSQGTLGTNIKDYPAYMLFPRGDRTIDPANIGTTPTNAVIRASGTIGQTDQLPINVAANGLALVGNPFPSPIDFDKIIVDNPTIDKKFYIWDSRINSFGAYRLVQKNASNYTSTPFIVAMNDSIESGAEVQHIQSGQGFFVVNSTASPIGLTIKESHKSENTKTNVFSAPPGQSIQVNLNQVSSGGSAFTFDGITALFDDQYSANIDKQDVKKLQNFNENFSLRRASKDLMLEARPAIQNTDTLFFRLWNTSVRKYQFLLKAGNMGNGALTAFMVDKWLNTQTQVALDGSMVAYNFNITSDEASANQNRFMLVFIGSAVLPINFTNVKAFQKNNDIQVEWNLGNESNISKYEVEKSVDGRTFTKAGTQAPRTIANANENYNWLDITPNTGNNFYRIKAIEQSGQYKYSEVVNVKLSKGVGTININPNPVTGQVFNLQFINQPAGKYAVQLFNALGQEVYRTEFNHAGGSATQTLRLKNKVVTGIYQLHITTGDNRIIKQLICE